MEREDLEEMRFLREKKKPQTSSMNKGDDMASVMGFSNFGGEKKAKQFDFMAMFEEAKKTATERSHKTFESQEESAITSRLASAGVEDSDDDEDSDVEDAGPSKGRASAQRAASGEEEDDDDFIGPPIPKNTNDADSDVDEEDDEDDYNPIKRIPRSSDIVLNHGTKTVSALALDPSGSRLVTGGVDYDVKFFDFAGMDTSFQSFRTLRPCESHQIRGLEYSTTGDKILVVSGNWQPKLIDRDGFEVMECPKGDQYIIDQSATKGHTGMLNSGCWHPQIKEEFMTCSNDCTVRLWNTKNDKKHKNVIKAKGGHGRKTIPTSCAYSRDGNLVAAACQDGSIQMWDHRKNFVNVALKNMTAHMNGTDTSSLKFALDGKTVATRGGLGDDTVKLWDIRNIKKSLAVAHDLENLFPFTDVQFSPGDRLVMTGVSVRKDHGMGKLVFLDPKTLDRVAELNVVDGASVVKCLWHPRLNQIMVGCGDGSVKIYYDLNKSHKGAKLCISKTAKKSKEVEMMVAKNIITPYALPMFRKSKPSSTRKQEERARKDPLKSHRPDLPVSGPGHGGRLGNKGATLSQYVAQNLVKRKPDERDKDPRAAILRHAKEAEENPFYIDPAYKNQARPILQEAPKHEEQPSDDIEPVWKKKKV